MFIIIKNILLIQNIKKYKKYIQNCDVCQRVKAFRHRFYNKTLLFLILTRS